MRSRVFLALVTLAIPAGGLAAQRRVMIPIGHKTPERPVDKPPLMPGVHDSRMYSRYMLSRFSLEQYPMMSYLQANGAIAKGIPSSNFSFGDGTHLSFRAAPSLFITSDFTSSFLNGPFSVGSSELGVRVKPWTSPRVAPFADARVSWAYTTSAQMTSAAVPFVFMYRSMSGDFASGSGHGAAFALGADTRLSARFFLTSALTSSRYAMEGRNLTTRTTWDYSLTATRLSVGVRYNPGRWLDAPR